VFYTVLCNTFCSIFILVFSWRSKQ